MPPPCILRAAVTEDVFIIITVTDSSAATFISVCTDAETSFVLGLS